MKSTICPYDKKVICSYMEPGGNPLVSECWDCTHFRPHPLKRNDPAGRRSTIGCLIAAVVLIIGFLAFAAWIINQLREPLS